MSIYPVINLHQFFGPLGLSSSYRELGLGCPAVCTLRTFTYKQMRERFAKTLFVIGINFYQRGDMALCAFEVLKFIIGARSISGGLFVLQAAKMDGALGWGNHWCSMHRKWCSEQLLKHCCFLGHHFNSIWCPVEVCMPCWSTTGSFKCVLILVLRTKAPKCLVTNMGELPC